MKRFKMVMMLFLFAASVVAAFAFKTQDDLYLIEGSQIELYTNQPGVCVTSSEACFYRLKAGAQQGSQNVNDYEAAPGHENKMFVRD